ncbi:MAG: NAD(+) synthase [Clostridiales bacterium]|nr:NAD(+) synthase [Clostridiales bacterium]
MYNFDAKKVTQELIQWIKDYFEKNGKGCKAVVGISGGKDSSIVAALCKEALGKENVYGVLMPQGQQSDIDYSYKLCEYLGIDYCEINIGDTVKALHNSIPLELNNVAVTNIPARIRMTILYAVSAVVNGRVANTCNLSEDWVGYVTKFGDGAGDFSPLADLTVTEIKQIGRELGLPEMFIEKTPLDGLTGKTDEDILGFSYEVLDRYIREGICEDRELKEKIDRLHKANLHKLQPMPRYSFSL